MLLLQLLLSLMSIISETLPHGCRECSEYELLWQSISEKSSEPLLPRIDIIVSLLVTRCIGIVTYQFSIISENFFFRKIKNSFLQLSMVSRTTNPSSLAASLKANLSWKIPKSQVNAMMILKWWKCSMMKNTLKWRSHYFKLHIYCTLTNFDVIFISNCQVNDGATHKQGEMQENFWPPVFLEILNKTSSSL